MVRIFKTNHYVIIIIVTLLGLLGFTSTLLGHGGKSHGETEFTALQAVQKATELYNRLVMSGKLQETWETGLVSIEVGTQQKADKPEYVVKFKRMDGDPNNVYFFFDLKGKYTGSNFTGQ